jgi:uncharacterized phosphosugar-binding protein
LDGQGDANAQFIFKTGSTLVLDSAATVVLINGAASCRVFWNVGSSATLGTTSTIVGTVVAQASITATTGAIVNGGRLLALTAAVTLDSNLITVPDCTCP